MKKLSDISEFGYFFKEPEYDRGLLVWKSKGFEEIKKSISNLLDKNRIALIGPILIELIQGCRTETEKESLKKVLNGIHSLTITDELWDFAAEMAFALRRKGITVSAIDAIIAFTAIKYNIPLLHRDGDFDLISKQTSLKIYKP